MCLFAEPSGGRIQQLREEDTLLGDIPIAIALISVAWEIVCTRR